MSFVFQRTLDISREWEKIGIDMKKAPNTWGLPKPFMFFSDV